MTNKTALFVATLLSLTFGVAEPAFAGKGSVWASGRAHFAQYNTAAVSLSQVLETINAQEPGTQLDTNTVVENGRTIYVVRWQASRGRIIIFRVDAETGQIIGRQG
jgi:uncharacterized membrane protein YkoI